MMSLGDQLCPWALSKQIIELGGTTDSYFKWVHPWQSVMYKENKRKYIPVEWYNISRRKAYPAFMAAELAFCVSDHTIIYHNFDGWICYEDPKTRQDLSRYSHSLVTACAYAYIELLKTVEREMCKEAEIKERGLI
jgi:hypothetical protein